VGSPRLVRSFPAGSVKSMPSWLLVLAISSSNTEYESDEEHRSRTGWLPDFFFSSSPKIDRTCRKRRRKSRHFHPKIVIFPESRAGDTAAPHTAAAPFPVCRQNGFPPFPAQKQYSHSPAFFGARSPIPAAFKNTAVHSANAMFATPATIRGFHCVASNFDSPTIRNRHPRKSELPQRRSAGPPGPAPEYSRVSVLRGEGTHNTSVVSRRCGKNRSSRQRNPKGNVPKGYRRGLLASVTLVWPSTICRKISAYTECPRNH